MTGAAGPRPRRALGAVLVGGRRPRPRDRPLLALRGAEPPAGHRLPALPPPRSGLRLRAGQRRGHRPIVGGAAPVVPARLRGRPPPRARRRRPRRAGRHPPDRPAPRRRRRPAVDRRPRGRSRSRTSRPASPCRRSPWPTDEHAASPPAARWRSPATPTVTWCGTPTGRSARWPSRPRGRRSPTPGSARSRSTGSRPAPCCRPPATTRSVDGVSTVTSAWLAQHLGVNPRYATGFQGNGQTPGSVALAVNAIASGAADHVLVHRALHNPVRSLPRQPHAARGRVDAVDRCRRGTSGRSR